MRPVKKIEIKFLKNKNHTVNCMHLKSNKILQRSCLNMEATSVQIPTHIEEITFMIFLP